MKVKKYAVMFGVGLLLSALLTGCGFLFGLIFELPGDWDMAYKWPGKSTGYAIVSFYTNGLFEDNYGDDGYWTQDGLDVRFTYTGSIDESAQYRGQIEFGGEYMSGTMYDPYTGVTGTWDAYNLSSRASGSRKIEGTEGDETAPKPTSAGVYR